MTEASSLLEKYSIKASEGSDPSSAEFHAAILSFKPDWEKYDATRRDAGLLKLLEADAAAIKNKALLQDNLPILKSLLDVLAMDEQDPRPSQWVLTVLYDMLRADSSCYAVLEDAAAQQIDVCGPLTALLAKQKLDPYVADKAAWLLTAMVSNMPEKFTPAQVADMVGRIAGSTSTCSELGVLEAVANLLKTDTFRSQVWKLEGVSARILRVSPGSAGSPLLYKCAFCIWLLSYDAKITAELKSHMVIRKLKEIIMCSRVEKVVRISLTALKGFLASKDLCEEIVEENLLDAVQVLEYEKWRDADLYDDIRDMTQLISTEVQEMSNFDRYLKELHSGKLSWGYIHSPKFWADNNLRFEENNFGALKMLASLLLSHGTDTTTLAVACHDLGEFVSLHPLGKKKVAQLNVKERVMELMASSDAGHREVRREALLCCQKIMLNKWQEMDNVPK